MFSLEKAMEQSTIGFAKHQLIYDEKGNPKDYIFLSLNPAFERLTGLKREVLLNRRVTEVMPKITQGNFDWIGYYGNVVTKGERKVFNQYSAPLDKWYRVEAFSCEKDSFTTLFTDITNERELVQASKAFLNDEQNSITYEEITKRMRRMTGADYVALNVFLEEGGHFQTVAIAGISGSLQKAANLLGFNPLKKEWAPDPHRMALIREKSVTTFDHLHELTSHVLSKKAIQLVEKTFQLGQTVIVKSTHGERIIGDFTLMFSKGSELQNENETIIYADMVGMLIEKRKRQQELDESKEELEAINEEMIKLNHQLELSNKRLQDSEEKLSTLFQSMSEHVVLHELVFDDHGNPINYRILACNRRFTEVTGITEEQAVGKLATKVFGTTTPPYLDVYASVAMNGTPHHFETFFPPMDKHFSISVVSTGKNGFATITSDITEQKKQQIKTERLKEQYELAVAGTNDGIWDWKILTNELFLSKQWKEMLGYEDWEIKNDFNNFVSLIYEEDVPRVNDYVQRYLKREIEKYAIEFRMKHKDGSLVWIFAKGEALRDENGVPYRMAGSHSDIGERKEMEEKLKENQIRLEYAMDSGQHGFWDMNLDTDEIYCSPRYYSMLGYEPDEFLITPAVWRSLIHPEDRSFVPNIRDYLEKQEQKELYFRVKCKDNSFKWIATRAKGHERDSQGIPHRAVGVHVDIDELKQKTEALKEAQRMAKMGRWDYDYSQDVVKWTDGIFDILEINPQKNKPSNQAFLERVHPDDREQVSQAWVKSRETHQPFQTEHRLLLKNEKVKWVKEHFFIEYDEHNNPFHSAGIIQDITEQKRLENDIRKNEEKYRTLFETMAQGVLYHDGKGRIITANPAAEKILGLSLRQMHGRTSADPIWKAIDEDSQPFPEKDHPVMVTIRTGQPVYGKVMGVFNPQEEKYHWLKVNTIPQNGDEKTHLYQVYATFDDITQEIESNQLLKKNRIQLEASLQETDKQKQQLEAMHEIAVNVLNSTDFLQTATKLFNDCKKLTGATSGYVALLNETGNENEILYLDSGGSDCSVNPTLPMPIRGLRGIAYQTGDVEYHNDFMHSQHWRYMPKGHLDLNNVLFAPLKNGDKTIGLLGLGNKEGGFTDEDAQTAKTVAKFVSIALLKSQLISQLTREKKKAEEANQAKSIFLANMNHELRTPLNGIIGFSDILRTMPLDEEQKGFVEIVYTSGKHLADIITDILDFSRIEAGKFELNTEKTELKPLIENTLSMVRPKAEEKCLCLSYSIEHNVPDTVEVDGSRLRQVLLNQIANAVKFTDEGSVSVSVSLLERQRDHARLLFKVTDTGMGIKEEEQKKIFEPFHQADMTTDKKSQGTGLGLAISKKMLELMGANLELESEYGKGSTFSFELLLPCDLDNNFDSEETDSGIMDVVEAFTNKKVLIAEDNSVNMQYAQTAINMFSKDIHVIQAKDGKEAYQLYREHKPDLILMDIRMPKLDGYQATTMIRAHDEQTPIIAMTAKALQEDKEACLAVGMNEYLTKPVSLGQLKDLLKKYL